jgi:hypothetical protein
MDLATTVERIQQNFCICDPNLPDNPIVFASDGFLEMSRYDRFEVLGRNCRFMQARAPLLSYFGSCLMQGVHGLLLWLPPACRFSVQKLLAAPAPCAKWEPQAATSMLCLLFAFIPAQVHAGGADSVSVGHATCRGAKIGDRW